MRAIVGRVMVTAVLAAALLSVVGCEPEGPAERAGKQIDEAAEDAGDAVEDAGDKVQDAVN